MATKHRIDDKHADKVKILYGGLDHISAIMPVMHSSFDDIYGEAWNEHQCRSMLMLPGSRLLIAQYSNQICGFAISRIAADEEELLMIAVHPEFRKRSIGKMMLNRVIETSASDRCRAVFLEVRENNLALNLYRSMGFEQIGFRKAYYTGSTQEKYDAITFKKEL